MFLLAHLPDPVLLTSVSYLLAVPDYSLFLFLLAMRADPCPLLYVWTDRELQIVIGAISITFASRIFDRLVNSHLDRTERVGTSLFLLPVPSRL